MANNTIYANIGTYGVNDTPSVGPLMQAQTGVVMLFTLADLTGAPIDLTDLALSGTITNNLTTETAALAGALTIVTPAAGVFSWTTDEDDVGTAGDFTLIFMAGADIISLPAHLSILETPGASVTFGAALIGVTTAERAWLTAALAALPDASQLGAPVDVQDLTTTNGGVNDLVVVTEGGGCFYIPLLDLLEFAGGPAPIGESAGLVWTTMGDDTAAWQWQPYLSLGGGTMVEGGDINFGTVAGTKIAEYPWQKFAFWGATPVVQQVLATGAGATADDIIALLQTLGLCRQS